MKFPIFNLSYPEWEETVVQEFRLDNDLFYSTDDSFITKYFLEQTFIDSDGALFKLTDFHDVKVKKLFLFSARRKRFVFEKLNQTLSFEELKKELIERSLTMELEEVRLLFKKYVDESNSIEELLNKM